MILSVPIGAFLAVCLLVGCSSAGSSSSTDQAYLGEIHGSAVDIGQYRSDSQLVRLGHAVCDDFRTGASYQTVADRLGAAAGASRLPSADLGAVMFAAADKYCPQYRSKVS